MKRGVAEVNKALFFQTLETLKCCGNRVKLKIGMSFKLADCVFSIIFYSVRASKN